MYTLRTVKILIKLLPSILALRKDRKKWINQNKNEIDLTQFKKNATKVLETFLSLGPVYIKLGQWLSSRADILPQPYLEELSKLQDSVPAAPFEQIKPKIEKDIGLISEKFDDIDPTSISGAIMTSTNCRSTMWAANSALRGLLNAMMPPNADVGSVIKALS